MFQVFQHYTCVQATLPVDQAPTCVPAAFSNRFVPFIHSHLVSFSAPSVADMVAFLFASLVRPSIVNTLQSVRPASHWQPTSRVHNKFSSPSSSSCPPAPGIWYTVGVDRESCRCYPGWELPVASQWRR